MSSLHVVTRWIAPAFLAVAAGCGSPPTRPDPAALLAHAGELIRTARTLRAESRRTITQTFPDGVIQAKLGATIHIGRAGQWRQDMTMRLAVTRDGKESELIASSASFVCDGATVAMLGHRGKVADLQAIPPDAGAGPDLRSPAFEPALFPTGPRSQDGNMTDLSQRVGTLVPETLSLAADEQCAGADCHRLRYLIRLEGAEAAVDLWLDRRTGLPVRRHARCQRQNSVVVLEEGLSIALDPVFPPDVFRPQAVIDHENEGTCRELIRELTAAVKRFELDKERYPGSSNTELVALLEGRDERRRPYFTFKPEMLSSAREVTDPWGRPLHYRNNSVNWPANQDDPGAHNKTSFDLWSAGADGVSGTPDDITNW